MYIHHIVVLATFFVFPVKCGVYIVTSQKTWDEAVEYCKRIHNGTLSSKEDIRTVSRDWMDVWTKSFTLTKWLSFEGCYHLANMTVALRFDLDYDVTKRCSEGCGESEYIGINAEKCVCLSKTNETHATWKDCNQPKSEFHFKVYRAYEDIPRNASDKYAPTDSTLNCGTVKCRDNERKIYPKNCSEEFIVLCDKVGSKKKKTWKNGIEHCLEKQQPPQSFENRCKKGNGRFRERGGLTWIGMYRPVGVDNNPFLECTYWSTEDQELVNCTQRLPFFCTGEAASEYPRKQNPVDRNRTSINDDGLEHSDNPSLKMLIIMVIALCLVLFAISGVVIFLFKRTRKIEITLQIEKLAQKQNATKQMETTYSQEQEKHEENIYEFEEIEDTNVNENKLALSCRNFTVKCPLPSEAMGSAGEASDNTVSTQGKSPECVTPEPLGRKIPDTETAGPCNSKGNSDRKTENQYDSFKSIKSGNNVVSDTYDHAKIVNVERGNITETIANHNSLPPDERKSSETNIKDGVYELAKVVENDYDELVTKSSNVNVDDTYDHVPTDIPE